MKALIKFIVSIFLIIFLLNQKVFAQDNIKIGLIGISVFVGIGIVLSIPVWLLWNWLMPNIFGLPVINVLEALGLSILITL